MKHAIAITIAALTIFTATSRAQSLTTSNDFETIANKIKNPTSWLSWGADLRIRDEYFRSANMMLNRFNEYDQLRTRARVWAMLKPSTKFDANVRFAWESRNYFRPDPLVSTGGFNVRSFESDEVVVDNLNFSIREIFNQPLVLTAGRQDLFFGNGWIFGDGTPRDGSRTLYTDAARVTWDPEGWKTQFNLLSIFQYARSDAWLPPFHDQAYRRYQTEQNEHAIVLYAINKSTPKTQIDAYLIYLESDGLPEVANSVSGQLYGFGARALVTPTDHWELRTEFLPEFGHKNGKRLLAFGSNSRITYKFLDAHNNRLRLGYEFLSGDDQSTPNENGRFDPLWGRWPQYSELFAYQLTTGPRVFEYGNYHRINAGWSISLTKKLEFSADYHVLFAVQNEPFTVGATYQSTGDLRGHLLTSQLEYIYNKHIKGHLRAEAFFPGDYYNTVPVGPSMQMETFLRAEIFMTF